MTCTITVIFFPKTVGTRLATLAVTATPGGTITSALTGTASAGATIELSPSALDFGSVSVGAMSAPKSVTVKNTGAASTGPLWLLPPPMDFVVTGNTCSDVSLDPHATCTIAVAADPTSAGPKAAEVLVGGFMGGQASLQVSAVGQ